MARRQLVGGEAAHSTCRPQICVLQHRHLFVFFSSAATLSSVPDGGRDLCVSRPPVSAWELRLRTGC